MPGQEASTGGSTGNALLDALLAGSEPPDRPGSGKDLAALLELVTLEHGQLVHESGMPVRHVLFPRSAVVGLLVARAGAPPVEAMAVGDEGVVGLTALWGDGTSPHRALCQVPGQALRWPVHVLRDLVEVDPAARGLVGQHVQATVVLLSQRVACSQRHTAQQRCADWLLRHADRIGGDTIPITQKFLAAMLGLRRTTVSAVVSQLQRSDLITHRYGRVTVTDREALQRLACDCYQVFRDEMDRLADTARGRIEPPGPLRRRCP